MKRVDRNQLFTTVLSVRTRWSQMKLAGARAQCEKERWFFTPLVFELWHTLLGGIMGAGSSHRLEGRADGFLEEKSIASYWSTELNMTWQLPDLEVVEHEERFKDVCVFSFFRSAPLACAFDVDQRQRPGLALQTAPFGMAFFFTFWHCAKCCCRICPSGSRAKIP